MKNTVVLKSNKAGMTVILDPSVPFEELLADIAAKFQESARFWGSVQMTLTLSGRPLTAEEEFTIVNVITEHSQIQILCLVDQDINRTRRCEKALNEKLMELSAATGQFYRGRLKRGEQLESEASIVIIGDVEAGARITAKGNIVVLGELYGTAFAGISGNSQAVVTALRMAPSQLRIADSPMIQNPKNRVLIRGYATAFVENGKICLNSMKKSIFPLLNSSN